MVDYSHNGPTMTDLKLTSLKDILHQSSILRHRTCRDPLLVAIRRPKAGNSV